ncbi:MAG: ribonuclease P protein component [Alphaproteobacteria bacterium]|nr:ribonuclease P protein component [Alphaproteobacteria bacterium]
MPLVRIKRHFDFLEMRNAPFKAFTKSFVLQMRPNKKKETRVGFTVSKKIDKRAVVRNKLRRQMREIVRLSPTLLEKYPSHDLILIARSEALERSYAQLSDDFEYLLTHFHETDDAKNSD